MSKMNKVVSKEDAIILIKKNGGKVINENFVVIGETATTYKGFIVEGKKINEETIGDFEITTYKADLDNPVMNNFIDGTTMVMTNGSVVRMFKKGAYTYGETSDGKIYNIIGAAKNGCEVKYIKKEKACDKDTWKVTIDMYR